MIRSTTNATLKSYRYNLQRSTHSLNQSRETVLTQRNFNSFAEDPAAAARSFQLRRSYLRTESQHTVGESVVRKYEVAWSALESVVADVNNRISDSSYAAIIKAESDSSGAGRNALGQSLSALAEGIVHTMNSRSGDNFVFAGTDGLNVPFTWENGELHYRGINVNATVPQLVDANGASVETPVIVDANKTPIDPAITPDAEAHYYLTADGPMLIKDYNKQKADADALKYMATDERKYADLGFGLQENADGSIIDSSAANVALQGITYLGYGTDEDGDPKNIASLISRMGEILQKCDADSGNFASDADKEEFYRLAEKFEAAAATLNDKHVELDTQAAFLKDNQSQLESISYTLQDQIVGLEDADLADAITSYSWAQYCYNAALKVGNSILSQSLMDYLNS